VRALVVGLVIVVLVSAGAVQPTAQQQDQPDTSRASFGEWLAALREEALGRGISKETVEQALGRLEEPLPVVIERDRTQAESTLSLETYVSRRVTPAAVRTGRQMLTRYRTLLDRVSKMYDVPAPVIVAVWGMESNFGRFSGVRPTVPALATLAWDPRRSALFRRELFSALEILDQGHIDLPRMRGSWAGAMGQPQFMPSSYLKFAEDFDGDGRRDIWASRADVFASVANYLRGQGWKAGERWGREVKVATEVQERISADVPTRETGCLARRTMTVARPLEEWQRLGVRLPDLANLPSASVEASLVSGTTRRFLVYGNYDVLLEYNCAHPYALSVALLSEKIAQ
jgi:membrane-bound lytic murein transglycosylase B